MGDGLVCVNCFSNPGLRTWVEDNTLDEDDYNDPKCDFCPSDKASEVLADLDELIAYITECVEGRFTDPVDELMYVSAEGGYQGDCLDCYELLEHVGLNLPNDASNKLWDRIALSLSDHDWCQKNYFSLTVSEALRYSWEEYVQVAKGGSVLEFMYGRDPGDREATPPAELLDDITEFVQRFNLIKRLEPGYSMFRVRKQEGPGRYRTADEMGPPPGYASQNPNRLNPKGTEVMYASDNAETALAETPNGSGNYAIGEFKLLDAIHVVDLTELPSRVCFFDLENAPDREAIKFLHHFAKRVSEPLIEGTDRDVEYRPTQIVTQHLRRHLAVDGAPVHGIRFSSAQHPGGINLGLFGESIFVCDEPPPRKQRAFVQLPFERSYLQLMNVEEREQTS